jgi:DNA-binding NtrC family response regulator
MGRGSTFKVYLPRVEESAGHSARMQHSEAAICGSETVLVAEDDLHVRNLTVAVLKACGYSVLELENPSEAERVCEQHSGVIDLLLTDVIMRDMSGPELARVMQKLRPQTKVLFMSGYTDTAIVHKGVLEPGIDFLAKPFTPSTLAGKVRQVLDQAKA